MTGTPSHSPRICAALLAAGQSRRFGDNDKLAQPLHGRMLGLHAAERLVDGGFADRIAIVSEDIGACVPAWQEMGFQIRVNPQAHSGMGTSVALAASHALEIAADGLLICLADMPFLSDTLLTRMLSAFDGQETAAVFCAAHQDKRSPPALFGLAHFADLAVLAGDSGARELIGKAQPIPASAVELTDIDTGEELASWNTRPLP